MDSKKITGIQTNDKNKIIRFRIGYKPVLEVRVCESAIEIMRQSDFDSDYSTAVATLDRKTHELTWYLDHCCGASGFGQDFRDICPACDYGPLLVNPKNMFTISCYGRAYSKDLHQSILDIGARYTNLEKAIQDVKL